MAGILKQAQQVQQPPEEEETAGMEQAESPDMQSAEADAGTEQPVEGEEGSADERMPGQEDATPEEQEMLDRAKAVGLKLLSQKGTLDRLIDMVRKQGLPGIAEMIATFVVRIDEKMDLPETVIFPLASEMGGFVASAVERSRVIKISPDDFQKMMGTVFQSLAQAYGQTPADAKAALDEMEQGNGSAEQSA